MRSLIYERTFMSVLMWSVPKIVLMFMGVRDGVLMTHAIVYMNKAVAVRMSMPAGKS